ncbi:MAG: site-specific integrase [Acidobacteriota bacterium]|nr:site-specific integrase [Acidobacteriota bacterium]
MAGQVIKRGDDTWLVRIFTGRDAKGKRPYYNKTIRGTKKDAQKWLTSAQRDKDLGIFVEPAAIPLDDYLSKWLETVAKRRVRERTFEGYEWLLKQYVRPAMGAKRLCDIHAMEVQSLYNKLSEEKKLSAKTVRHVHQVLSSALSQAVKWKLIAQNPCGLCELSRKEKKEMRCLTAEESTLFLKTAKVDKWYVAFLVALETGMRPEEYLGLRWPDVDFERGAVIVRRALVWLKGGGWKFDEPKTQQSRRSIPLTQAALGALRSHKREQAAHILKSGAAYEKHDLVFAGELGTPFHLHNLRNRHFKKILKDAKLPSSIRLYDLRHTCATLLLAAGEHPKIVSERLGHASVVLTLDTYSHVLPNMQQSATEKLERMLYGA